MILGDGTGSTLERCLQIRSWPHIGLSDKEAKAQGITYRLFKISIEEVLRARTLSETRGFLKALVDVESDRILGFTAFAVNGGEIMASVQTAIMAEFASYCAP